jgi:hypothetical protein
MNPPVSRIGAGKFPLSVVNGRVRPNEWKVNVII